MTQHDRATPDHDRDRDPAPIEQPTPFDEATDLLEADDINRRSGAYAPARQVVIPPLRTLVILVAVLLSPLFGLVFGLDVALGVLVAAMAFTTWLAWEGASQLESAQASLLRRAAMVNALVALMALALLLVRVYGE
jgi:hypothetical protein